jgi:hypothetical protein
MCFLLRLCHGICIDILRKTEWNIKSVSFECQDSSEASHSVTTVEIEQCVLFNDGVAFCNPTEVD